MRVRRCFGMQRVIRRKWPKSAITFHLIDAYREPVEKKRTSLLWTTNAGLSKNEDSDTGHPDPDLDAIWRIAAGLDLGSRSVLEAEVLMWRICTAKSMPPDVIRRAQNQEWEND